MQTPVGSAMPEEREQLVERTLEQVHQTMLAFVRLSAVEWLDLDLTMGQLKALVALTHAPSATVSNLGDLLGIGISASSHLIDRLVQMSLVERSEDSEDRRRTLVRLTPAGEALVTRLRQGRQERLTSCLRQLTGEQLTALLAGLGALCLAAETVADGNESHAVRDCAVATGPRPASREALPSLSR